MPDEDNEEDLDHMFAGDSVDRLDDQLLPFQVPDEKVSDPSAVWAEFNQRNKDTGRKLLKERDPSGRILALRLICPIAMAFLTSVEKLGSAAKSRQRAYDMMNGGPFTCALIDAHRGGLQAKVEAEAERLWGAEAWLALRGDERTFGMATISFSMISAAHCTLDQTSFRVMSTFPYKLWSLLTTPTQEVAMEILTTPDCLLDTWTACFLRKYNSWQTLLSDEAMGILCLVGSLVKFDICHIECRHAMIRKLSRSSTTWLPVFQQASAGFSLSQYRRALELARKAETQTSYHIQPSPLGAGARRVERPGRPGGPGPGPRAGGGRGAVARRRGPGIAVLAPRAEAGACPFGP